MLARKNSFKPFPKTQIFKWFIDEAYCLSYRKCKEEKVHKFNSEIQFILHNALIQ